MLCAGIMVSHGLDMASMDENGAGLIPQISTVDNRPIVGYAYLRVDMGQGHGTITGSETLAGK